MAENAEERAAREALAALLAGDSPRDDAGWQQLNRDVHEAQDRLGKALSRRS